MAQVLRLREVQNALNALQNQYAQGMEIGLRRAGLFIQRKSQEIVPIDVGTLRNSADTRAEGKGYKTVVTVSYGTDYALYVHEDLNANHAPGRTAKYLEIPLRDNADDIARIVSDAVGD